MTITSTLVPEQKCPTCGTKLDAAASPDGATPNAGDFTICVECGEWMRFNDDLTLRSFTKKDVVDLTLPQMRMMSRVTAKIRKGR